MSGSFLPTGDDNGSNNNHPGTSRSERVTGAGRQLIDVPGVRASLGVLAVLACGCYLSVVIAVGTAIGNGVPMARSASQAFEQGMKQGIANCPCNAKRPVAVTGPTPLKPVPEPSSVAISPTPLGEPQAVFK